MSKHITPEERSIAEWIVRTVSDSRKPEDASVRSPFESVDSLVRFCDRCVDLSRDASLERQDFLQDLAVLAVTNEFRGSHTLAYRKLFSKLSHARPKTEELFEAVHDDRLVGMIHDLHVILDADEFAVLFRRVVERRTDREIADAIGIEKRAVRKIFSVACAKARAMMEFA